MRLLGLLSAVALLAGPALAQAPTAPAPAATVAEVIAGVDIPFEQFTLPNGLRVVVHTDRKAPVVSVAAWYNVGSKDEPAGQTGFAHLFEHMMFEQTENIEDPSELIENLGSPDSNGSTWFDRTNYYETVPTAALETALFLESERMGHLLGAVTQERLNVQRAVVQNEKRQGDNQPFGLVEYAVLEALFPEGHPYRHDTIGSMADLDAASLDAIRTWFRENYGPNNAVLVLAGDIDAAAARPLVERYFGDIPRGPQNIPAAADVPTLAAPVTQVMQDRVANVRLYRTWAVPGRGDETAVPLAVAADVLGGLASSRLDNLLVRGEQTAVAVTASLQQHQRVSFFQVTVDVRPDADPDAVSRRLDAIIAQLIAEGPTADEVQRSAMRTASRRVAALERVGGKSNTLAEGALYHDDPGFFRQELAAYAAVTPASVQAATQRWLTRPVFNLRVNPGPRPDYQEAGVTAPGQAAAPATTTTAAAPTAPRPAPVRPTPPIGEVAALDLPDVRRARLSNGMEVIYAQRDAVPMTQVAIEFEAGVAADRADRLGTQSLMLSVMDEATRSLDAVALAEAKERLGLSLYGAASLDRTIFSLTALSANIDPSLALMADVIRNPGFAPAEIERLRAQLLSALAQERTQPAGIARRALPGLLYGNDHPYGRPPSGLGTPESLAAVTRDDLVGFHETWIRPDTARVFVVSNLPLDRLMPALEARFGDWAAPARPRGTRAVTAPAPAPTPRIVLIDRPQSPQSLIYAGAVLPISGTDDTLVFDAGNEVVGQGFLSRINFDLRETRGWSYGVRAAPGAAQGPLAYVLQAPVQADRTGESIAALIADYRAFAGPQGATEAERLRVVNGNTRVLAGTYETSGVLLNMLRQNALLGRPDDYWERAADRYRALTPGDLDAAVRAAVDVDRFVWVVVGDAATVRPQLERLGLPVEVRPVN